VDQSSAQNFRNLENVIDNSATGPSPTINQSATSSSRPPRHPQINSQTNSVPSETPSGSNPKGERKLVIDSNDIPSSTSSTPRREESMKLSVTQTPIDKQTSAFKYYCPLCMCYFKDIFKVVCCEHYICYQCTVEYLNSKSIEATTVRDILSDHEVFKTIACPHCSSSGFIPLQVSFLESPRDYSMNFNSASVPGNAYSASPVRIGDSFADLKRKMISFEGNNNSSSSPNIVSGTGIDEGPDTCLADSDHHDDIETISFERQQAEIFVNSLFFNLM
jgi:hypothetical protein